MLLHDLVDTSRRVAEASGRLEKIGLMADLLRQAPSDELEIAVSFLTGSPRQGRIGVGPATIYGAMPDAAAGQRSLGLRDVDDAFARIAATTGPGSAAGRHRILADLLEIATKAEQEFLARLALGELRQGALEGLVAEAVARAAGLKGPEVRRALAVTGDLGKVAAAALGGDSFAGGGSLAGGEPLADGEPLTSGREAALADFGVQLFRPVQPMLAQPAEGVADAMERLGEAALEWKLDGARVQIHKAGRDVAVYSRRLNDVTAAVPEVVEAARSLAVEEAILDGEAISLRPDGTPHPFQVTMRRFGRRLHVERMRTELPLSVFLFDILRLDGGDLLAELLSTRVEALADAAPVDLLVPRTVAADAAAAQAFLDSALQHGHEGVMAKALDAPYQAGARGRAWLKVKPSHTLDLVVLAAEWGHGRRHGWLSNLHLGARDTEAGGFAMLGKTFKGMTDQMLAWQTERLLALEIGREGHVVHVRPELVVEIASDGVQASPHYESGLALRFARVKRYRPDKRADQADTLATVREIHRRSMGTDPPYR